MGTRDVFPIHRAYIIYGCTKVLYTCTNFLRHVNFEDVTNIIIDTILTGIRNGDVTPVTSIHFLTGYPR